MYAIRSYYVDSVSYEEKAQSKFLRPEQKPVFETLLAELEKCPEFIEDQLESAFAKIMEVTEFV